MTGQALINLEEARAAATAARHVLPHVEVLPHMAMMQLGAYVYMTARDLMRLCELAEDRTEFREDGRHVKMYAALRRVV